MLFTSPIASLKIDPAVIPTGYKYGATRGYRGGIHQGLDLGKQGDTIVAAADGRVKFAGQSVGYGGLMVYLEHGAGWETRYMHFSATPSVKQGAQVQRRQTLGKVGMTGITTSPAHLHFEILRNGNYLNPLAILTGTAGAVGLATLIGAGYIIARAFGLVRA